MELENFKFNKTFGQNFLRDKNLLNAIVRDSGITEKDEALEIGTGAGTLTEAIAKVAKMVVSYEIDKKLTEFLTEKFAGIQNVKIKIQDALKTKIEEIEKDFSGHYYLIANLPYYITTPLIFKFLEDTNRAKVITIMVQKEVAEKAVAKAGSSNYGILSVMLNYYCTTQITRIVKRDMFVPRPKVDSAILRLERRMDVKFDQSFSNFVSGCFAMKRKTLSNNLLKQNYSKEQIEKALSKCQISQTARAETLTVEQFQQLYQKLVTN